MYFNVQKDFGLYKLHAWSSQFSMLPSSMKYFLVPTNRDLADYLVFVYLGDDSVVAFDCVGHALEVIVI